MRRELLSIFLLLITGLMLLFSGCGLSTSTSQDPEANLETIVAETVKAQEKIETAVAQTLAVKEVNNIDDVPTPDMQSEVDATMTLTPTITNTSTIDPTSTLSVPKVQVGVDTNCRFGPGVPYDILGALLVGEQVEVVGRWSEGDYWIVQNPDNEGECWLWGRYATLEGPTDFLPVYTQPPTPTPTITPTHTITPTSTTAVSWTGSWSTRFAGFDITVTLNQSGSNVTGSFTAWAISYSMNGTLSSDKMTLTGTYTDAVETFPFLFHLVNPNQFNGNGGSGPSEWCGYRSGAGFPSPCTYP